MLALNRNDESPPAMASDLEEIFKSQCSRVFAAAFRVTGSAQDAEDVLQTVFLRLVRRGEELNLSPNPSSYLHRAAINASLDLLRTRSRSSSIPLDEMGELPSGTASPHRRQEDREVRRNLRQALLGLTPRSAEIFAMRFFEDMSNREIAQSLGMSQTAVGVAIHRARSQVKGELVAHIGGH